MTPTQLTPFRRKAAYTALFVLNAALVACNQAGLIPATYAQVAALVSFILAGAMKHLPQSPT